jgi:hypothetical protein
MSEIKPEWIEKLASRNPEERADAATEICRAGRQRADLTVRAWWENADFARLCGPGSSVTVGLAVQPITFAKIREANDWPHLANVPPEHDASEFELHFAGGISLDILTTRDAGGSGAIARFLAKFGEGVQQVEFRCDDVDRAAAILREKFAVQPLYPAKRPGADGTNVNFFLVPAPDQTKVLIELYEASAPTATQP